MVAGNDRIHMANATRLSNEIEGTNLKATYSVKRVTIPSYTHGFQRKSGTRAGIFDSRVKYSKLMEA